MSLLVIITLSLTLAILLAFLMVSQMSWRGLLLSQLAQAQSAAASNQLEIQRLTNLIASKDPMTFYHLQQGLATENLLSEVYQGTGSDEDEFKKWAKAAGRNPEDYTDELAELGL